MVECDVWCRTDKGLRRESNQDSFLINHDLGLFVVADGMGGHSGGEVASQLAVQTVEKVFAEPSHRGLPPRELIQKAYEEASHHIFDKAARESQLTGMGTTMVICYVTREGVFLGNVGDSRIYLFQKPYVWQVTEDHSLANEQIRAGVIRSDQVRQFIGRNVITRSVGYERDVIADVLERPVQKGDLFLMCSDGLSGMVTDQVIGEVLNQHPNEAGVNELLKRALAAGGEDNVTIMLISIQ
ncbi:MAG: Stp1/IreP family PP2C-type Ser/Thr phosphatase [Bdellovibrio sp.]|nr:MAG: Stp1/IreP family PP2C-type Ser/Thr phosphatase [Bdellovibrio sp.]